MKDTGLGGHRHHFRGWDVLHQEAHSFRELALENLKKARV